MSVIKLPKEKTYLRKKSVMRNHKRQRKKDLNTSEGRMTVKTRIGIQRCA